jgi:thioredoxin-like negative regulator of GroEL
MPDSHRIPDAHSVPALTQFDFHSRMVDLTGITLVAFTAVACGACRHLRQVLHQLTRQEPEWHLFEIDAEREQALTNEFEVFHLPTIFLFVDGQYHCQLHAEAHPRSFVRAVHAALQQPAVEAP